MDSEEVGYELLDEESKAFIGRVLAAARRYLGARVSFLAEMVGPGKFVRAADGAAEATGLAPGTRFNIEDSYCYRLLNGRIPEAIYDARSNPLTCGIPLTSILGIDSYMGVPVLLGDGRSFGTLCCVNFEPAPENSTRDLAFLHFLADLVGRQLESAVGLLGERQRRLSEIQTVLVSGGPTMVFHPVMSLSDGHLVAVEALARFDAGEGCLPPDIWFRDAWAVGKGLALELAAIRGSLWALDGLPETTLLTVNASPSAVLEPEFLQALRDVPPGRLVVEITEHAPVEDYDALRTGIATLAARGIRVAIDDVGAGYSSLRHVLALEPQFLKLDASLTKGIDQDLAKQAMAAGVMAFASRTGARVIAEGIQTEAEAVALQAAGVIWGQGFLYGEPEPLTSILSRQTR